MFLWLIGCSIGLDPILFSDDSGLEPAGLSEIDIDDLTEDQEDQEDESNQWDSSDDDEPEYEEDDLDGDGYTPDEGDCDDDDASIHPAAIDDCNGVDNNCDGEIDERAAWDETGSTTATDIGEVPSGYTTAMYGLLFPEGDTDSYLFYVSDGPFGWFNLTVQLSGISSADASLRLDLVQSAWGEDWGEIDYANEGGFGEAEQIEFYGTALYDDSGWYQLTVTAADGADCSVPYELVVSFSD